MAAFIVTNLNDSGAGSLRQALADAEAAAGADSITFDAGLTGGTLRLTTGQLVIAAGVVDIDGDLDNDGTADITISGDSNNDGIANAGDTSLLRVAAGADVGIGGLVLADGFGQGAGGTYANRSGANAAGAIENFGALTIANSVFRDNSADGGAGFEYNFNENGGNGGDAAGAILNAGSLTVTDTEFANNRAGGGDGGDGGTSSGSFGGPFLDGSPGGNGGLAAAGILNLSSGGLVLTNVVLRDGAAQGGSGGAGGNGSVYPGGGYGDGGGGGNGSHASAGIINQGVISGDARAYAGSSVGGAGGAGGAAEAVAPPTAVVMDPTEVQA